MNPRFQEMKARMEADMQLNREAAEKTIVEIHNALDNTDDPKKKQVLTRLLFSIESQLERLQ